LQQRQQQLVFPDDDDLRRLHRSALDAESKGRFRRALRLISDLQSSLQYGRQQPRGPPAKPPTTTSKPPSLSSRSPSSGNGTTSQQQLWSALFEDERRLMRFVYGPRYSDDRASMWRPHAFRASDPHPPELSHYSWSRYGSRVYRYGGREHPHGNLFAREGRLLHAPSTCRRDEVGGERPDYGGLRRISSSGSEGDARVGRVRRRAVPGGGIVVR